MINTHMLVKRLLEDLRVAPVDANGNWIRAAAPVPATDLLSWLLAQHMEKKWYWRSRDGQFESAALGAVHQVGSETPLDHLQNEIRGVRAEPPLRWYGGLAFDRQRPSTGDEWAAFERGFWVLPAMEYLREGDRHYFAITLPLGVLASEDTLQAYLASQVGKIRWDGSVFADTESSASEVSTSDGWQPLATDFFLDPSLHKIVPARCAIWQLRHAASPLLLLRRMVAQAGPGFTFYFQPQDGVAFAGCSPELLLSAKGNMVQSEAVAGTAIGTVSLQSEKDREEHAWVVRHLRTVFGTHCEPLQEDAPSELSLPYARHLQVGFQGQLRPGHRTADVLMDLYPTPAVSGYPVADALSFLRRYEPFDRGWYAGAVGWVSHEALELAVGIRSALLTDRTVRVFAGAGFVKASDPMAEWTETENKMYPWRSALEGSS